MKISTTVGYAVAALLQLANHRSNAPLPTSAIASGTEMPERYLLQIMKTLKDAGLVTSLRGVKGGYTLAKPIGKISLQDVCEAIDGGYAQQDLATGGLTALSQRLLANVMADVADDERRRLGAFKLDALKLSKWLRLANLSPQRSIINPANKLAGDGETMPQARTPNRS